MPTIRTASLNDATEILVASDEIGMAIRSLSVFGFIDLAVGAVHPDSQYLHEHAAPIRAIGPATDCAAGEMPADADHG